LENKLLFIFVGSKFAKVVCFIEFLLRHTKPAAGRDIAYSGPGLTLGLGKWSVISEINALKKWLSIPSSYSIFHLITQAS